MINKNIFKISNVALIFLIIINSIIDFRLIFIITPIIILIIIFVKKKGRLVSILAASLIILTVQNIHRNCFIIEGYSMYPSMRPGDICVTRRIIDFNIYKRKPGSIVVFAFMNKYICKRLVATTGDWVEINNNIIYFKNCYKYQRTFTQLGVLRTLVDSLKNRKGQIPQYLISKKDITSEYLNKYFFGQEFSKLGFVVGDNPKSSFDSFYFGYVPLNLLKNKVLCIIKKGGKRQEL